MTNRVQSDFSIQGRKIGPGCPVYIVAELSANHHQDFDQAVRLVHVAKDAGADAVKLQTYTADTLTIDCDRTCFRVSGGTIWDGRSLHTLYREAHTPWEWQPKLRDIAEGLGLHLFSSPFDNRAVDFLERMHVPAYKLASFEIVDIPLIRKIAGTARPLIISTGMATLAEIEEAVQAAREGGASQIALLKCTSSYPASPDAMNLRTVPELAQRFGLPVGLSDHSMGISAPVAAVALGACIVEKHLTLSRAIEGPDSAFSLEPDEFKNLVDAVRSTERALGDVCFGCADSEYPSLGLRRSLFVVQDMKRGQIFTDENVCSIRPAHGLHPRYLPDVLGHRAAYDIERGTPLAWELVGEK